MQCKQMQQCPIYHELWAGGGGRGDEIQLSLSLCSTTKVRFMFVTLKSAICRMEMHRVKTAQFTSTLRYKLLVYFTISIA